MPTLHSAALCDGSHARSQQAGTSVKHSKTLQRIILSSRKQSKLLAKHSTCANEPSVSADRAAVLPGLCA